MKKGNKSAIIIAVGIIVLFGLLGAGNIIPTFNGSGTSGKTTRELAMSCTLDMYTQFHIHPHLSIRINGLLEVIPTNIGVALGCMHPIHTHDALGTIHVESPEQRDFTLGDFFAVWEKIFTRNQILDYRADIDHEIIMTVDGKPSLEFENFVLKDNQQIAIEFKKK